MPRRIKRSRSSLPSVEQLERRQLLAVSSGGESSVVLSWQGRTYEAIPDSYLLKMPAADTAVTVGAGRAAAPVTPESWSVAPLGGDWFELQSPGASVTDVQAWASAAGITSIEPNQVLVKQRYPFDSFQRSVFPNDTWFGQYQWGLHNTGDTRTIISPESAAAARLGNAQNIFPRWPISSGRVDGYGNLLNDADIDAPEAWFKETGSRDVIVVVMDDGVDHEHPDLNRNMWFSDLIGRGEDEDLSRQFSDNGVDGTITGFAGAGFVRVNLAPGVPLGTTVEIHRNWERIGAGHIVRALGGGVYEAELHGEQAPLAGNAPGTPRHGAQYVPFDVSAIQIGDQVTTRQHISRWAGKFGFNSAEYLASTHFGRVQGQYQYIDGGLGVPGLIATQPGDPDMVNRDWDRSWRGANDSHGTHVAGIIGATGSNSSGVTGMAWATSIYSANIFRYGNYVRADQVEGSPSEDAFRWQGAGGVGAVAAMVDAVGRIIKLKRDYGQNIAVVNMSFNTYNYSQAMFDAVENLSDEGILVVTAAGNGYDPCEIDGVGDRYTGQCDWRPVYPAAFDLPNIINVTASTAIDRLARFANWGPGVDIAAPGENIWSTVPLSARRFEPGREQQFGTDVPIRYDSREPFEPPPSPGLNVPQMIPVPNFGGFTTQPLVVRPLMYRQVPQTMIEYDRVNLIGREGGFSSMSGTSMSAGYVTGTAALVSSFYFTRVGVLPDVAFVRGAILGGADITPTLTYRQQAPGDPPFDYQMRNRTVGGVIGTPVALTGMYIPENDPHVGTVHSIPGNLRLNANGALQWCIDRMPPSVQVGSPSTLSRLEGDEWSSPTPFRFTYSIVASKFGPTALTSSVDVTYWTEGLPGEATPGVDFLEVRRGERFFTLPQGFAAGAQGTFDLPIVIGDSVREKDEQFRIRFAVLPRSSVRPPAYVNPGSQVTTVIRNDDASNAEPAVRIDDQNAIVVNEGRGGTTNPTVVRIPVTLDRVATRTVLVPYQVTTIMPPGERLDGSPATPGTDFVAQNGTLSIARGQRGGTISFRVIGNDVDQADRSFVVRLIEQPNHGVLKLNRSARLANNVFVTIRDDDDPVPPPPPAETISLRLTGPAGNVVEGDAAIFSFELDRAVKPGWALTIVYRTESGSAVAGRDFVGVSSKLTLRAGQRSGQVAIRTLRDRATEASETFSLRILSVTYRSLTGREQGIWAPIGPLVVAATIEDRPLASTINRALLSGLVPMPR